MTTAAAVMVMSVVCFAPNAGAQHFAAPAPAQTTAPLTRDPEIAAQADDIIRQLALKQSEIAAALPRYTYTWEVHLKANNVIKRKTSEYRRIAEVFYDDHGRRVERVRLLEEPQEKRGMIRVRDKDLERMTRLQDMVIPAAKFSAHRFTYVGTEAFANQRQHVFDVAPRTRPDPRRWDDSLFEGRLWIDARDFQITRARGKRVPDGPDAKHPFAYLSCRKIDGKFWFPDEYRVSRQTLLFASGTMIDVEQRTSFTSYRLYRSEVKVIDEEAGGEVRQTPGATTPQRRR